MALRPPLACAIVSACLAHVSSARSLLIPGATASVVGPAAPARVVSRRSQPQLKRDGGHHKPDLLKARGKQPRLPRSRGKHEKLALKQFHRSQVEGDVHFDKTVEASLATVLPGDKPHRLPPMTSGSYPALVLNADYRPLSYLPLSLMSWQDSVRYTWPLPAECVREA